MRTGQRQGAPSVSVSPREREDRSQKCGFIATKGQRGCDEWVRLQGWEGFFSEDRKGSLGQECPLAWYGGDFGEKEDQVPSPQSALVISQCSGPSVSKPNQENGRL